MIRAVVVGKPGAGKTRLVLKMCELLGIHEVTITQRFPGGGRQVFVCTTRRAMEELVSDKPHFTRCTQSVEVEVPVGKGRRKLEIVDTTGLSDGIDPDPDARSAMAHTLQSIPGAKVVLHVIDGKAAFARWECGALGEVDREIARYASFACGYVIAVNKVDLPEARKNLGAIAARFPGARCIATSAVTGEGIMEVIRLVARGGHRVRS